MEACGGWNEDVPLRLRYLDIWSSDVGAVWVSLGDVVLLKEVGLLGWVVRSQNSLVFPPWGGVSLFWNHNPREILSSVKLLWSWFGHGDLPQRQESI